MFCRKYVEAKNLINVCGSYLHRIQRSELSYFVFASVFMVVFPKRMGDPGVLSMVNKQGGGWCVDACPFKPTIKG